MVAKTNEVDVENGIMWTSNGDEIKFDPEDYDKIKDYCWRLNSKGYVYTTVRGTAKKENILMHRLIMDAPDELVVDHKNHNTRDNRKKNLRCITNEENQWNKKGRKDNKSGIYGVNWNSSLNKWVVRISVHGKRIWIGSYTDLMDASNARREAEKKYYGEFAYENEEFDNDKI